MSKRIPVTIPEPTNSRLRAEAERTGRGLADIIVSALVEHLDKQGGTDRPGQPAEGEKR